MILFKVKLLQIVAAQRYYPCKRQCQGIPESLKKLQALDAKDRNCTYDDYTTDYLKACYQLGEPNLGIFSATQSMKNLGQYSDPKL